MSKTVRLGAMGAASSTSELMGNEGKNISVIL